MPSSKNSTRTGVKGRIDVSVIMPVSHEPTGFVQQALESIRNQTIKRIEIIIVIDNPSNKALVRFVRDAAKRDARIAVIANDKNIGLPASLNKGISIAQGRYIARMDGDDVSLPNRLATEIATIEKTGADVVSSNKFIIDADGKELGRSHTRDADVQTLRRTLFTMDPHPIVHPSVLAKAEVFKRNPYDERFRNSQDFELWLRLTRKGCRFRLVEAPLLRFRVPHEEDANKRLDKNARYARFGLRAAFTNYKGYWSGPWFYMFTARLVTRLLVIRTIQVLHLQWIVGRKRTVS